MGVIDDVVRSVKGVVNSALEQWTKVVPCTIVTTSPLTVRLQGGVTPVPARFSDGGGGTVGDQVYALIHPGRVGPLVFGTTAGVRPWAILNHTANGSITNATWTRTTTLSMLGSGGDIGLSSSCIQVNQTGWYDVVGSVAHNYSTSAGRAGTGVDIASSTGAALVQSPTSNGQGGISAVTSRGVTAASIVTVMTKLYCSAPGQFIRLQAFQDAGAGTQTLTASTGTFLMAHYIGK